MINHELIKQTFDNYNGIDNTPLEELLALMSLYGKPRVSMVGNDNGWHSGVDMFVMATGVTFEIKSDFGHPSPRSAVIQCIERLEKALKDLNK